MTDTTPTPALPETLTGHPTAHQLMLVRRALDDLATSLTACRVAVETAKAAPDKARYLTSADEIIADWEAHNLLIDKLVDNGYFTSRYVVDTIKDALNLA